MITIFTVGPDGYVKKVAILKSDHKLLKKAEGYLKEWKIDSGLCKSTVSKGFLHLSVSILQFKPLLCDSYVKPYLYETYKSNVEKYCSTDMDIVIY